MNRLSILFTGTLTVSALALTAPALAAAAYAPPAAPGAARSLGAASIPYMQSAMRHRPRREPPMALQLAMRHRPRREPPMALQLAMRHRPRREPPMVLQLAMRHRPRREPPMVTLVDDHGFRGGGEEGEEHEGFEGGHVFIGGGFGDPYWGGYGWGPAWYGPGYGYTYARASSGLKLKIAGPDAKREEVFANGGYVGTVSDFNGWFQELHLRPGQYHMEIRTPGYKPLNFNVLIPPGQTVTYHGDLQPAQ